MIEVIDNAVSMGLVSAAQVEWPNDTWPHWHRYNDCNSVKYSSKDATRLTPACRLLVDEIAQRDVPDGFFPDLTLYGAGMHMIKRGGHLSLHRDAERHPVTGWYRRLNAVLYLTDCSGGELVIGNKVIKPVAGRLVTFSCELKHSVNVVESGVRNSLALFWWSLDGSGDTTSATFEGEGNAKRAKM